MGSAWRLWKSVGLVEQRGRAAGRKGEETKNEQCYAGALLCESCGEDWEMKEHTESPGVMERACEG